VVPPAVGANTLRVSACDAQQRCSAERLYTFTVGDTTPLVSLDGPVVINQPATIRFAPRPGMTGIVSYTWYINPALPVTIAAEADGTATYTRAWPELQTYTMHITSRSANGWVTPEILFSFTATRASG
jgi:hypothetical protein